jgi:hypothetical protein
MMPAIEAKFQLRAPIMVLVSFTSRTGRVEDRSQ